MILELDESDRQLVLMALAHLSLRFPGFDDALNRVAMRIDNVVDGRAKLFDGFRELRNDEFPTVEVIQRAAEHLAYKIWNYERPNEGAVDEAPRSIAQVVRAFVGSR